MTTASRIGSRSTHQRSPAKARTWLAQPNGENQTQSVGPSAGRSASARTRYDPAIAPKPIASAAR